MSKHFWSSAISSEEKSPLFNHNFTRGRNPLGFLLESDLTRRHPHFWKASFIGAVTRNSFPACGAMSWCQGCKTNKQIGDGYAGVLSNNLCNLRFWRGSTNGLELLPNQNINLPHAEKWTFPSELLFFLINQRPNIFKCEEKSSNRECTNQQPQLGDTREPVFGDDAVC